MSKTVKNSLRLLQIILLTNIISTTYVTTVLDSIKYFSLNSQEEKINFEYQTNKKPLKKYTIWGWFKFNETKPGISNFLILSGITSIKPISQNTANPDYPACPYTKSDFEMNPDLKDQSAILDNPNCFLNGNGEEFNGSGVRSEDYLIVNHELLRGEESYSLTFMVINGFSQDELDFEVSRFGNLPFVKNLWTYFAVSCDYETGVAVIHIKEFNLSIPIDKTTKIPLNYPNFELKKENQVILSNREKIPYYDFSMNSFFTGNIAYIETAPFFTNKLQSLWAGYLPKTSFPYNGVLMQILFDVYDTNSEISSTGLTKRNFQIEGEYTPLYKIDKSKLGIKVNTKASLNLGKIDFEIIKEIKPLLFHFELIYKNDLPNNYILLERGNEIQDGYIKIILVKQEGGRAIKFSIVGRDNELTWKSSSVLPEGKKIFFIVGVVLSPGKSIKMAYYDSNEDISTDLLGNNFTFNILPQEIVLFKQASENRNNKNFSGFIEFLRFEILNSASSIIFKDVFNDIADKDLVDLMGKCDLKSDYYKNSFICLRCNNSVLTQEKTCENFCPMDQKNFQNGICIACRDGECNNYTKTKFEIEKISNDHFRLKPDRKIVNFEKIDFKNLFQIKLDGKTKEISNFDYQTIVNTKNQSIDYKFDFNQKIQKNKLEFNYQKSPKTPYFDENRNLLQNMVLQVQLQEICYLSKSKNNALTGLAVFILILFLICLITLILISIFVTKIKNKAYFWKFFLSIWMNMQLVTFFLFYGVNIPCCVQRFLHILFKISVKWNYALRWAINNENHWKEEFQRGVLESQPEGIIFVKEDVRSFVLHNMGLLFVFHLVFLVFYLVYKILSKVRNFQRFKGYVDNLEFTGILVVFLAFHIQIVFFSCLNLYREYFGIFYFGFSFFVALLYIFIFAAGFIFFGIRIFKGGVFFMDSVNKKRFGYFLVGIIQKDKERIYEYIKILIHFFIAVLLAVGWDVWTLQAVFIFVLTFALLVVLLVLRPFLYFIHLFWEILSTIFILVLTIIFLIIAVKDDADCIDCIDREGSVCWFIVLLIFFICVIGCLVLLVMLYLAYYNPFTLAGEENIQNIIGTNEIKGKKKIKTKNEMLEDVITSHSMLGTNKNSEREKFLHKEDVIVKENMDDFMVKMQNDRKESKLNKRKSINYKRDGGDNLLPDSEDEDSKMPKVISTLINFKEEEEEVGEDEDFDYFSEKKKSYEANSRQKMNQKVEGNNYFNYNNPSPPKNPNFFDRKNQFISDEEEFEPMNKYNNNKFF